MPKKKVVTVEKLTGQGELFGGRVKTLHPYLYAGILSRPNNNDDVKQLKKMGMDPIDLVVVNLYPFQKTVAKRGVQLPTAIENIDIGGVALIRAAAKNHGRVTILTDPSDYQLLIDELEENQGSVSLEFRKRMALKGFQHTALYDSSIQGYLFNEFKEKDDSPFPDVELKPFEKVQDLRYGENSHQRAALYVDAQNKETSLVSAKQLWGKELSYNNICDIETALEAVRDFEDTACVILKHANPCGVATAKSISTAYKKALECDPVSAFGGIVGFNQAVDAKTAKEINKIFIECVIAPSFDKDALEILKKKKNIRLLQTGKFKKKQRTFQGRTVVGGLLLMDRDIDYIKPADWKVVTKKKPTQTDLKGLEFALKVVKWVKSNAIVLTSKDAILGVGAGQMNRVDSVRIAIDKSRSSTNGSYLGSDAFFPFRDSIDAAAKAGVRAIIQPGGSMRDQDSIDACNEHGIVMVTTGMRHFRH